MLDPDIHVDEVPDDVVVRPPERRRRIINSVGQRALFLVIAVAGGWPSKIPDVLQQQINGLDVGDGALLLGMVVARWRLAPVSHMSGNANNDWAYGVATCRLRTGAVMNGFLVYETEQSMCLAGNVAVDATASILDLIAHARLQETTTRQTLGQWIDGLEAGLPSGIATLKPGLAAKIMSGEWCIFKSMAVGPKIQLRKSQMLSIAPSLRKVKKWLVRQSSVKFHRQGIAPKNAWPADLVVDWVSTTQYLKDIKFAHEAADCFAKLLTRKAEFSQHELTQALDYVNRDTLRKAR
eukprot:2115093-Pyramimonas_sp.AAC.1